MPNTAIQIDHLSKMYRLGVINNGTLFLGIFKEENKFL